jgi:hypothetical protein
MTRIAIINCGYPLLLLFKISARFPLHRIHAMSSDESGNSRDFHLDACLVTMLDCRHPGIDNGPKCVSSLSKQTHAPSNVSPSPWLLVSSHLVCGWMIWGEAFADSLLASSLFRQKYTSPWHPCKWQGMGNYPGEMQFYGPFLNSDDCCRRPTQRHDFALHQIVGHIRGLQDFSRLRLIPSSSASRRASWPAIRVGRFGPNFGIKGSWRKSFHYRRQWRLQSRWMSIRCLAPACLFHRPLHVPPLRGTPGDGSLPMIFAFCSSLVFVVYSVLLRPTAQRVHKKTFA